VQDAQEAACQQNQHNQQVSFENGIQGLLEQTLPTIKDELRCIRKPSDISIKVFFQQMIKINKFIGLCPVPEQQYDNNGKKALMEQACPPAWLTILAQQQNYPTMTLNQVKAYYKLLESFESGHWEQQTQQNVDILDSMVEMQEQWVVVLMVKQPADDSVCQLAVQVVLVDEEPNLDVADWNDTADLGVPIVEQPNMMAQLVSFTKPIEQGKM
jgi:hypothetical protein